MIGIVFQSHSKNGPLVHFSRQKKFYSVFCHGLEFFLTAFKTIPITEIKDVKMPHKKLVIAIALNLFVLPGMGHISLGLKKRGWIVACVVLTAVCSFLIHFAVVVNQQAKKAAEALNEYESMVDFAQVVGQGTIAQNSDLIQIYMYVVITSLVLSMSDLLYCYFKLFLKRGEAD